MNKIYKVVWNKARNCYVVGSEFISSHSTGKTSVIGSKSINAVLAVAAVCSMLYLGSSNVFAADAGLAQPVHYVAIHTTDTSVGSSKKYMVDNKEYTYTLQKVTYTDSNNKEQTAYYYVRNGYSVEMDQDKRHDEASTSNVLRVYRNGATADDTELLQSSQVMIKDAMNKNQEPIQTITGNTLQDVSAGTYVGASNGGGTGTPIDGSYEYFIQDNGKWVDARGVKTTGARFKSLTSSSNGTYEYKGQVVSIDNLYTVTEGGQTKVGVFVTSDGNLYTGKVFGRHNEVLMTTKNNDTIYSYWAAETMDPDSKIENMTIGQLNNMFDRTNTNVKKVAGDTIDRVDVAEASDKKGGTISLMRRGTYNSTTGLYENSVAVAGALKITSSGGKNGNDDDVAINIFQADGKGTYEKKFSIKAGSVVKANSDGENKGELQSITINGYKYTIPYTVDASKTKYYSVQKMPFTETMLGSYAGYTNEANDGAKKMGALAAGYMTCAGGIASTVTGSLSGVINRAAAPGSQDFRGATALSYGTFNINNNSDKSGAYSGVANSIVGQANMTTDSNAALIYGAGNVISNSYRDIDTSNMGAIIGSLKDSKALGEALQAAVPTSGGQVMAFGGGNVVDNAYMTQVMGVGNTVKGNQKKNNDGTWTSNDNIEFNNDVSSQLNYVDGFYTTLINGKNDYLIGAHNMVTGDSVYNNHSNIVIGDNHTLENQSNNIILGSADSTLSTPASQVTIVGHNANAKVNGGVALGAGSVASRDAGMAGYDPATNTDSTDASATWEATNAAVSVGNLSTDGTVVTPSDYRRGCWHAGYGCC